MAYRLVFKEISIRSKEKPERGYELEAVRDNGTAVVRLSGILTQAVWLDFVGEALPEGVDLPENDEKIIDGLMLLYTVARLEQALRSGTIALSAGEVVNQSLKFDVGRDDLSEIYSGSLRKDCGYRIAKDRDFFCSATRGNPAVRISPVLCHRKCLFPDSRWVCSHLSHLFSGIEYGADEELTCAPRAMCNLGRPEIDDPSGCRPGVYNCWERVVETETRTRSREYPPEALPEALDFLHATWCLAFGKEYRLLHLRSATDTAALVAGCHTRRDFVACISALDDVIKSMRIEDELLALEDRVKDEIKRDKTLNRLKACLTNKVSDPGQRESGCAAIVVLRRANGIRVALQHSGRSQDLPGALAEFDLSPTDDWATRWKAVREQVTEALVDLRKSLDGLTGIG